MNDRFGVGKVSGKTSMKVVVVRSRCVSEFEQKTNEAIAENAHMFLCDVKLSVTVNEYVHTLIFEE